MAQGYYTLQEAAKFLSMSVDELKQMAQKGQIRSFQDRGTLRFRMQDIQELARSRGVSSEPDMVLGDASLQPKSGTTPPKSPKSGVKKAAASPKTPAKQDGAPEVFEFQFDTDSVDVGGDIVPGSKGKPSSKGKKAAPAGSDSDVRLVADGSDVTFSIPRDANKPPDSDVRIASDPAKPRSGAKTQGPVTPVVKPPSSPRPGAAQPPDSGVRLVPMDSDSDVKLLGASDEVQLGEPSMSATSDSNVRLDKVGLPPTDSQEGMMLTEEINLDEEIKKQEAKAKDQPSTKLKPKSELKLPTSSPFELSDSDLELPSELKTGLGSPKTPVKAESQGDSSDFELAALPEKKNDTSSDMDIPLKSEKQEGSSDFDLTPADESAVSDSNDFSLEASDGDQIFQSGGLQGSKSGISLNNPVDGGISLEDSVDGGSSDFDLSLDVDDTPKPQKSTPAEGESSEFELTSEKTPRPQKKGKHAESEDEIDLSLDVEEPAGSDDDSEFELTLEGSGEGSTGVTDSESEFELTLDDSGNIDVSDSESTPQVKSKKKGGSGEQDIFDTDFEVPALEESDDATVADSELESSDFDIALDDSDLASDEESGSQVVALDEDSEGETVAEDDAAVVDDVEVEEESSDFQDLDQDVEVEEDVEADVEVEGDERPVKTKTVIKERLIQPAPWGVLPVVFMLPCVVIMFFVAILGFEAVQTTAGNRPPGAITSMVAGWMGESVTLKK